MGKKDPRVDAYIAKAAPFAQPILRYLRQVVHRGCPKVEETIKWGMPAFEYKGPLAGMAAFKAHCVFGYWKHDLIVDGDAKAREAMGSFGRITSKAELPSMPEMLRQLARAQQLNDDNVKVVRKKTTKAKAGARVHPEFEAALAKSPKARAQFDAFAPGYRRDYAEWIAEAKADATRARRIATAIEWIAAGKHRNWKYER